MKRIKFIKNPESYNSDTEYVAHLSEIVSKDMLLDELSKKLRFPSYFGYNWDALTDCLKDFHWIDQRDIILVHNELPKLDDVSFDIYIQILIDVVQDWNEDEEHCFEVVFPKKDESLIRQYLENF